MSEKDSTEPPSEDLPPEEGPSSQAADGAADLPADSRADRERALPQVQDVPVRTSSEAVPRSRLHGWLEDRDVALLFPAGRAQRGQRVHHHHRGSPDSA